jgi:hypothetical protein
MKDAAGVAQYFKAIFFESCNKFPGRRSKDFRYGKINFLSRACLLNVYRLPGVSSSIKKIVVATQNAV